MNTMVTPEACVVSTQVLGTFDRGVQSVLGKAAGAGNYDLECAAEFDAELIRPFFSPDFTVDGILIPQAVQNDSLEALRRVSEMDIYATEQAGGLIKRTVRLLGAGATSLEVALKCGADGKYTQLSVSTRLSNREGLSILTGAPNSSRFPSGLNTDIPLGRALKGDPEDGDRSLRRFGGALLIVDAVSKTAGFPRAVVDSQGAIVAQ